jgi:hypothetical protein
MKPKQSEACNPRRKSRHATRRHGGLNSQTLRRWAALHWSIWPQMPWHCIASVRSRRRRIPTLRAKRSLNQFGLSLSIALELIGLKRGDEAGLLPPLPA